jgi:hypothetical protein
LILSNNGASRIDDIGEYHGWSKKDIILTYHTGVNGYIVLHFNIIPQDHTGGNNHILSQVAVFPNTASCHDMGEVPDFRSFANDAIFVDDCSWMAKIMAHRLYRGFEAG